MIISTRVYGNTGFLCIGRAAHSRFVSFTENLAHTKPAATPRPQRSERWDQNLRKSWRVSLGVLETPRLQLHHTFEIKKINRKSFLWELREHIPGVISYTLTALAKHRLHWQSTVRVTLLKVSRRSRIMPQFPSMYPKYVLGALRENFFD